MSFGRKSISPAELRLPGYSRAAKRRSAVTCTITCPTLGITMLDKLKTDNHWASWREAADYAGHDLDLRRKGGPAAPAQRIRNPFQPALAVIAQ